MKKRPVLLAFFVMILAIIAFPQLRAKPGSVAKRPTGITPSKIELRLKINAEAQMELSAVSPGESPFISPASLTSLIGDLPGGQTRGSERSTELPNVVIEADPATDILMVFNPISMFPSERTNISVLTKDGPVLTVRKTPTGKAAAAVKPDPTYLLVALDAQGMLTLNRESIGKLFDLKRLRSRLSEIFDQRKQDGVLEASVTIAMAPTDFKFGDLEAIARAVRDAGSDRISLIPNFPQ
jgi:biopolymer transport protein ExbD